MALGHGSNEQVLRLVCNAESHHLIFQYRGGQDGAPVQFGRPRALKQIGQQPTAGAKHLKGAYVTYAESHGDTISY